MTSEPFQVGAYWGSRAESAQDCAQRLRRLLTGLADVHPALAAWYRKGRRRSAATDPVAADAAALAELLLDGRNRTDAGGEVMAELGFSLGLWNRHPVQVGLAGTVGLHVDTPHLMNNVVLDLPVPEGDAGALYDPATAEAVLAALVAAWEPDWATWVSWPLREAQAPGPREPVVGWRTYLGPTRAAAVGRGVPTRPLGPGLLIALDGPAATADPASAASLRRALPARALTATPL